MLTLYYIPTCPFCQRVLGEVEDMGIKLNLKDISVDAVALDELVIQGGKRQVPYLVDSERGVALYESGDIIAYLTEHYKGIPTENIFGGLRVHNAEDSGSTVCESCQ
jgi:glutaredoxin 3